jgi:hypothetical protein
MSGSNVDTPSSDPGTRTESDVLKIRQRYILGRHNLRHGVFTLAQL